MPDRSIVPALRELERAFHQFVPLFPRAMPLPIITVQSHGRRAHTLGWFCNEKWQAGGIGLAEINIAAEYLARDVTEIAETLIHEMVHYCNALSDVRDCSRTGYHNRLFRELSRKIGLNCKAFGYRGWSDTSLSHELKTKVELVALDPAAFGTFRRSEVAAAAVGSKLKLWQCSCGDRARVAISDFQAVCLKCHSQFVRVG